jgi:hypothetical protein
VGDAAPEQADPTIDTENNGHAYVLAANGKLAYTRLSTGVNDFIQVDTLSKANDAKQALSGMTGARPIQARLRMDTRILSRMLSRAKAGILGQLLPDASNDKSD